MSVIKLLDCTLRDGGYINNWRFGKREISQLCRCLVEAGTDIIEVGFLTDLPHTEDDALYGTCAEIETICAKKEKSMLAAMIALGEKEMNPELLKPADESVLDIVRITFHREEAEISRAISYAGCLMEKGYKVCMQPVGTTSYSDKQLIDLIEKINELKPWAFYLVDTLGILCKEELLRFIYLIDYNLAEGIKLGFHSHNNLQMSFANAQQIIEHHSKREFVIDCSVYGMGRGAGNLCTELIMQYTNNIGQSEYNMVPVLEAMDSIVYPIFLTASWGYSAHYYVAATHHCHPNYAAYLLNKQTLTMNQVDYILKNIPIENRYVFDRKLIHNLYYNFQGRAMEDADSIEVLSGLLKERNILVLAPGRSIQTCADAVMEYITEKNPLIISINGCFGNYTSDFVFISNQKRLYAFEPTDSNVRMILTSNLSGVSENSIYVDYSSLCNKSYEEADNSGIMLLRLLNMVGICKVALAGFDGFAETAKDNYYSAKLINAVSPDSTSKKNRAIALQLSELSKEIEIEFITPSLYQELCGL